MSTPLSRDLIARNHLITIQQAKDYILRFQANKLKIINGELIGVDNLLPHSEAFNAAAVNAIMQQDGCIGLRMYLGMNTNNQVVLVGCGVDEDGNDLNLAIGSNPEDIAIMQLGQRCPPGCSDPSQINTL